MKKNYLLILSLVLLTGFLFQELSPEKASSREAKNCSPSSDAKNGGEMFVCNPFLSKF